MPKSNSTSSSKTTSAMKPGEKATKSGTYTTGTKSVSVSKGDKLPPTKTAGQTYKAKKS